MLIFLFLTPISLPGFEKYKMILKSSYRKNENCHPESYFLLCNQIYKFIIKNKKFLVFSILFVTLFGKVFILNLDLNLIHHKIVFNFTVKF